MLQAKGNEVVTNFVLNEIVKKVDVMKLLQHIMQLITLQLTKNFVVLP